MQWNSLRKWKRYGMFSDCNFDYNLHSSVVERVPSKHDAAGSSPAGDIKFLLLIVIKIKRFKLKF